MRKERQEEREIVKDKGKKWEGKRENLEKIIEKRSVTYVSIVSIEREEGRKIGKKRFQDLFI